MKVNQLAKIVWNIRVELGQVKDDWPELMVTSLVELGAELVLTYQPWTIEELAPITCVSRKAVSNIALASHYLNNFERVVDKKVAENSEITPIQRVRQMQRHATALNDALIRAGDQLRKRPRRFIQFDNRGVAG